LLLSLLFWLLCYVPFVERSRNEQINANFACSLRLRSVGLLSHFGILTCKIQKGNKNENRKY
jgi:hypothetical protein